MFFWWVFGGFLVGFLVVFWITCFAIGFSLAVSCARRLDFVSWKQDESQKILLRSSNNDQKWRTHCITVYAIITTNISNSIV